jgi:hypothetical protein
MRVRIGIRIGNFCFGQELLCPNSESGTNDEGGVLDRPKLFLLLCRRRCCRSFHSKPNQLQIMLPNVIQASCLMAALNV